MGNIHSGHNDDVGMRHDSNHFITAHDDTFAGVRVYATIITG